MRSQTLTDLCSFFCLENDPSYLFQHMYPQVDATEDSNNTNNSSIENNEYTLTEESKVEETPIDAITTLTDSKDYVRICLDCNEEFKTKCRHCLGCRNCRNKSRCHFYECHGENVCAICEHCFEGEQCKICCPYCGQVYPTGGHWRRHVRVTHLGLDKPKAKKRKVINVNVDKDPTDANVNVSERIYKCTTCEKVFAFPHKLKRHEKIHSDVREFRCHVCEKEFVQKIHLTKHLLQHGIGDKRFKCHNCDKWFNHKISLKTHIPKCPGR